MSNKYGILGLLVSGVLLLVGTARAGSISGAVTNGDGQAIQGAQVSLQSVMGFSVTPLGEMNTDAFGHYQFNDVSGTLYVFAELDDLHTVSVPGGGVCISPYGCWNDFSNKHYVGEGDNVTLDAIVLRPAGALDVSPFLGAAASDIDYQLEVSNETYAPHPFTVTAQGQTRISSLPAGSYVIKFLPVGTQYLDACGDDTPFDALVSDPCLGAHEIQVQSGMALQLPVHLKKGIVFSGKVTDAHTGKLLDIDGYAAQAINTQDPGQIMNSDTDSNGYRIGPLLPRSYYVRFVGGSRYVVEYYDDVQCHDEPCNTAGATVFTPDAGDHIANVDASIEPRQWISGQVIDADTLQPLQNIRVDLMQVYPVWDSWTWLADASTHTDAQGRFVLSGIEPQGFTLKAVDEQKRYVALQLPDIDCDFANDFCRSVPIEIENGEWNAPYQLLPDQHFSGLTLMIHTGALVSGTVFNSTTGGPLSGAKVVVHDATNLAGDGPSLVVRTNASGHYLVSAFNPLAVQAVALNSDYAQLYQGIDCPSVSTCDYDAGTPINFDAGPQATGINFSLPPDANTLFSSGFDPL